MVDPINITIDKYLVYAFLDMYKIPYKTSGVNVGKAIASIECPFCADSGMHCGIFNNGVFSCWRCERTGSLYTLLKETDDITFAEYLSTYGELLITSKYKVIKEPVKEKQKILDNEIFPFHDITVDSPKMFTNYITKRGFTLDTAKKYRTKYARIGKYAQRLIIPVYSNDKMVAFQGRDVTGRSEIKYKTSRAPINDYLYNAHEGRYDEIIITEGVFDVWRFDLWHTVCSFGTHLTSNQVCILNEMQPNRIVIAWDNDAFRKAKAAARKLSFICPVDILALPLGDDPDSFGLKYSRNSLLRELKNCS